MGISIDPKKLEKLEQLQSVLELLQNPEQYNRLMAEVNATLKQQKDVAARYASVEAAEEYLRESRLLLNKTKEMADQTNKKLEEDRSALDTQVMWKNRELVEREAKLKQREDKVEAAEKSVQVESAELQKMKVEFNQYKETQKAAVTKRMEELDKMKYELKMKLDKMARIASE